MQKMQNQIIREPSPLPTQALTVIPPAAAPATGGVKKKKPKKKK